MYTHSFDIRQETSTVLVPYLMIKKSLISMHASIQVFLHISTIRVQTLSLYTSRSSSTGGMTIHRLEL